MLTMLIDRVPLRRVYQLHILPFAGPLESYVVKHGKKIEEKRASV